MSEIKRYNNWHQAGHGHGMMEADDGIYVLASDHDAAITEARDKALEEAAKACDEQERIFDSEKDLPIDRAIGASYCADAIRDLKSNQPK